MADEVVSRWGCRPNQLARSCLLTRPSLHALPVDYARPALEVLVELRQRSPHLFDQIEIWMDGGVRRGTDVVKALCLGATAVGLGRPFLFAQSGFGQPGAERAVDILTEEIERCMRFLGVTKIEQLGPHLIDVLPRVFASSGGHTEPSPSPPRPE